MCTRPMLIILVSVCFPFSRVSTWHQPAKTTEEESIQTDKWQGISGDSATFLVRRLHFIFQIINVNVIRTQSINHFNVFANSAEPTRLSLGQTLRAHDAARSNEDGLSQTRCSSPPVLVHIRARTSQLWLLLFPPRLSYSHIFDRQRVRNEGFEKHHRPTGCHPSPSRTASLPAAVAAA